MAEDKKGLKQDQAPEALEDSLNKTEVLLEENKDLISKVLIGIAVLVSGYFVYNNWVAEPAEKAAFDDVWQAQKYFERDSVEKAIEEFDFVASEHSGTKAGNMANLYLGLSQLKSGEFDAALNSFENFEATGKLFPGLKVGLIGDCHSELEATEEEKRL